VGLDHGHCRRVRVLVADDNPNVRRALALLFHGEPDIDLVGTAADGLEAHTTAIALRSDVVVMDLSMPRVDGVQATRSVVASLPGTPVVVLTASTDRALLLARVRAAASTCGGGS
jgi:DNA-binding NarL/FixJ family response regulator